MKVKLVKIISIIFLTISAVIGQLFDFKNTEGNINIWGLIALGIAIILGVFSIIVEYLEYRENKKQNLLTKQAEENRLKALEKIQLDINNSNNPIVPFKASFTIKRTLPKTIIQQIIECPTTEVQIVKNEYLRLVGRASLGDSPYNFEEERPNEVSCNTNDVEVINALVKNNDINRPSIEIDIIPKDSNDSIHFEYPPSEHNEQINKVRELRIYDENVYQDFRVPKWQMKSAIGKTFGIQNILRSKIIVKASYNKSNLPESMLLPDFTNIILYFGENPVHLLSFTKEQLTENQKSVMESEEDSSIKLGNDLAKEMFQVYNKIFEIDITDEMFNNQIRVY